MKSCPTSLITRETQVKTTLRDTWLAHLVEPATLDLGVMRLSPELGVEIT